MSDETVYVSRRCAICEGSGVYRHGGILGGPGTCDGCRGAGNVDVKAPVTPCETCGGTGRVRPSVQAPCFWCKGTGWSNRRGRSPIRWHRVRQLLWVFGLGMIYVVIRELIRELWHN